MSAVDKALRNSTGLVHDSNRTFGLEHRPKTLSSHKLAFLQDGKERRTCDGTGMFLVSNAPRMA
ncbi:hypothetical protein [Desulfosporosinus sp. OT]|uniref:hypothetical protein n=1 Tax=Desulfosporosinus sp. OT TaxID=913865 RepID=UPI001111CACE|nr:hypothetical protein [Desulfosporosinus sp. OT]